MIDTEKAIERFGKKYVLDENTNCWNWKDTPTSGGYGRFAVPMEDGGLKTMPAHRFIYELMKGPVPPGKILRHKCNNRLCVNPKHLICGTISDNARDLNKKVSKQKEQFENDIEWFMSNTGMTVRSKAVRVAFRLLRHRITTEELREYADVHRAF